MAELFTYNSLLFRKVLLSLEFSFVFFTFGLKTTPDSKVALSSSNIHGTRTLRSGSGGGSNINN